jgi:hypothetical protein
MNLNGMVSMWKVRELVDKATNMVMNYTETEAKVREATNDDPWGPSGQQMQEISSFTFTYEAFPEALGMLWKRMFQDNKQNWRRVYKSLLLLDYLVKNGSERVVTSAREHLYDLRSLENYTFVDEMGKDQGLNIRHKVTDMLDFIQDDDRLRDERKKSKKNKDKYVGMSNESMGFRSGGGGGMGGNWDSGWKSTSSNSGIGGRFDSDDDTEKTSEPSQSGVSEFKDDEDFGGKKSPRNAALPRKPSGGGFSDFNRSASTTSMSNVQAGVGKKSSKPSRKVDLGAAAEFASKAKMEQKPRITENNNQIIEFFAESSNPRPSQPDYVQVDDDFDPRAGEVFTPPVTDAGADLFGSPVINSNNDGGDFADFSSAFAGGPVSANSAPTLAAGDDLFGGFSSGAGGGVPASSSADLLAGLSGGPASLPVPAASSVISAVPGIDLFSGLSSQQLPVAVQPVASPVVAANSMDLLGGLDFAGGNPSSHQPTLFNSLAPSNNTFGAPSAGGLLGGPMSLPTLQPSSALSVSPAAAGGAANTNGAASAAVNVGGTWKDLGNLNNKLLNFSLTAETPKSAPVPMNAMQIQKPVNTQFGGAISPIQPMAPQVSAQHLSGLDSLL